MLAVRQRVTSQTLIETNTLLPLFSNKNETSQSGFFIAKNLKINLTL